MSFSLLSKIGIASTVAASFFLISQPAMANCDTGERTVRLSHVTGGTTHPKVVAANKFAERMNREFNGKLCVRVYPNSLLYGDSQELDALLRDDVQLLAPSLSKFGDYTKKFGVFDLPFIFADIDAAQRFTQSKTGKNLLLDMKDEGFIGLGYWMSGMKYFSANKPLVSPQDANGLTFRVQASDVTKAMISAMGAKPKPLPFAKVYGALQKGDVDGQENTWSNIYTKRFYNVQNGVTETNHQLLAYFFMTSTTFLDSLDKNTRRKFIEIANEATLEANKSVKKQEALNRKKILDAGGVIRTLTPSQRAAWVKQMKPVWKKFEKDIGKKTIDAAAKS